jgi:hypothetical protein
VIAHAVDADTDDLAIAAVELRLESRHRAKLRRADGSEVFGMGEEERPAVTDPFVKMDRALGGLGSEIRSFGVDSQSHFVSLSTVDQMASLLLAR